MVIQNVKQTILTYRSEGKTKHVGATFNYNSFLELNSINQITLNTVLSRIN
jgi:hypothetical protein